MGLLLAHARHGKGYARAGLISVIMIFRRTIPQIIFVATAFTLAACHKPAPETLAVVQTTRQTPPLATPQEYGSAVAAWQLSAFDDLSYLPTFRDDSEYARGWIKASFYIGLERFATATDDAALYAELEHMTATNGYDLGRQSWHADDQAIAAVYARVADRLEKPKSLRHVQKAFDGILANRATNSLEFIHHAKLEGAQSEAVESEGGCQKRWCWADALFMAPPAWAEVSRITGKEEYLNYAVEETKATIEYLFDPETHLFFRDSRYFEKRTENGKKVFWSRGNGWVFAGLARFIEALPADHPQRGYFIDIFQKMAAALMAVQGADGYWPTSLHDAELFKNPETSGTGLIGFGMAWGVNNGHLTGARYEACVDTAWAALTRAVDKSGKLGWVQQVGKDPKSTTENDSQIYGAGAFLLMASEMQDD